MSVKMVISVMARDRVGIVAAVSRAIYDLQGNIDSISQTVLRGYFALILSAEFPRSFPLEDIRHAIERSGKPGELEVSVKERDPGAERTPVVKGGGEPFVLTLLVKDRTGILSRTSAYLASRSINVVDLYAFTQGERFLVISQLMVPGEQDIRQIQIDLEALWKDRDVTVSLQHEDIFVATNEIDFRHTRLKARRT
jgi:glycine cleavage system transcriptional repressor